MSGSYELVRALRGPIMLVALGLLFAWDQAGNFSFERTWPILFILYGILKLIERLLAPPLPPPPQYPGPPAPHWTPPPPAGGAGQ